MSPDNHYKILYFPYNGIHEERLINSLKRSFPNSWEILVAGEESGSLIFDLITSSCEILQKRSIKLLGELKRVKPDLVVVSMDWHPYTRQVVELSNLLQIPTLTIIDEPIFSSGDANWYSLKKFLGRKAEEIKNLGVIGELYQKPISNFVCCQNLPQSIELKNRDCRSHIVVTGHPTFDICKDKSSRNIPDEVVARLPFQINRPIVTVFLSEIPDQSGRAKLNKLISHSVDCGYFVILKCIEYFELSVLDIWDKLTYYRKDGMVYLDGAADTKCLFDSLELLQVSNANIISPNNILFVQSLLLNKHTFNYLSTESSTFDFLRSLGIEDLNNISNCLMEPVNYSEHFVQEVLTKLLPATFDNLNSYRIKLTMDFAIQYGKALKQREGELINIFSNEFPELFDPFSKCKKEMDNNFNDMCLSKVMV